MGPWEESPVDREGSKDGPSKGGRRWWCGLVTWRGPLSATKNLYLCEEKCSHIAPGKWDQRELPTATVEDNWVPSTALL